VGLVPVLDESASKRRSTPVRKGASWLKPVLVQSAWAVGRSKGIRLSSSAGRRPKKAAIAVAASLLTAAHPMLKDGTFRHDLGADFLVKRDKARIAARLANRIKDLGHDVSITAAGGKTTTKGLQSFLAYLKEIGLGKNRAEEAQRISAISDAELPGHRYFEVPAVRLRSGGADIGAAPRAATHRI
jgi:hypothetical protein